MKLFEPTVLIILMAIGCEPGAGTGGSTPTGSQDASVADVPHRTDGGFFIPATDGAVTVEPDPVIYR